MYNKYTIEVYEIDNQIKAVVFVGKDCLGTVWRPTIDKKKDYSGLMESVGNVIYGQESKAKKETQSYDKVLKAIEAKNSSNEEK